MKAIVLTGINQMELRNVPEPTIKKDNEVLLKIERVGVCGSDVHYYCLKLKGWVSAAPMCTTMRPVESGDKLSNIPL
jgi:threonine dehydrogenase-like Zn-dependent dehydrogenase